jgi:hypothetical protein
MSPLGALILQCLQEVGAQRKLRSDDAVLARRVQRIKQFQQARFEETYTDLLANPRYAPAARFFLNDLYGPGDFARRDDEFARIVPALVRLFPQEIVSTVLALAQLHSLSESLDTGMAQALDDHPLNGEVYGRAWRAVGRPEDRERQVELMLAVGAALNRYTRNALLRHSLRLMRGPSQAAGLGSLQNFLETGFETFRAMNGATGFLAAVATRERALSAHLFGGGSVPGETCVT